MKAMFRRYRVKTRIALVMLAASVVCAIGIVSDWRAVQVRYYRWQMWRAWDQAYGGPKGMEDGFVVVHVRGGAEERYKYYRQKLCALGAIVERHYVLRHIWTRTDDGKQFTRLLVSRSCPNYIDFESPYPDKSEPMQVTVWCWPRDASAWDEFIRKHDIARPHDSAREQLGGTGQGPIAEKEE